MNSYADRPNRKVALRIIMFLIGLTIFVGTLFLLLSIVKQERVHTAIQNGDIGQVAAILDHDPSKLEQRDRLERTPLHLAAWKGKTEILKLLILRGADVNAKWDLAESGDGGWNALHITAIQGEVEAADILIRNGIHINCVSLKGETPLDVAIRNRNWQLVNLLREHGGVSGANLK